MYKPVAGDDVLLIVQTQLCCESFMRVRSALHRPFMVRNGHSVHMSVLMLQDAACQLKLDTHDLSIALLKGAQRYNRLSTEVQHHAYAGHMGRTIPSSLYRLGPVAMTGLFGTGTAVLASRWSEPPGWNSRICF